MSRLALLLGGFGLLFPLGGSAQAPASSPVPDPPVFQPPGWEAAGEGDPKPGARRRALLLGVSRHANHPDWDLPCAAEDLRRMAAALNGLPGGFEVEVKRDQQVTVEAVRNYFTAELPRQLKGEGHLLLVYFTGHGVIQDGDRGYFTHYTDLAGGTYQGLIAEKTDLMRWVAELKSQVDIQVVFVVDACAPAEKAPAGRPMELELGDAAFYAAPRGELAGLDPKREVSAFTAEVAAAIADLGKKPRMTIQGLQEALRDRYPRGVYVTAKGRRPDDLVLQDLEDLGFELRAVDGSTSRNLAGARVSGGNRDRGVTPCKIRGFAAGAYRFSVALEGYLRRHVEVDLDARTSGGIYLVPLYPRYLVLQGRVLEGGSGLEVEMLGGRGRFCEGYHLWRASLADDGRFRLILPLDASPGGVRLCRDGRRLAVREFTLADLTALDHYVEGNRVPVHDLGAFRLAEAAPSAAAPAIALAGEAKFYYGEGERLAAAGVENLEEAIACFKLAREQPGPDEAKRQLSDRIRFAYETIMRHCASDRVQDFALGARIAGEALMWEPESTSFRAWKERCERENIPAAARRELARAAQALESGSYGEAEALLTELLAGEALTAFYRNLVERNLAELQGQLFREQFCLVNTLFLQNRDAEAVAPFAECRRLRPLHPILKIWERRLAESRLRTEGKPSQAPGFVFLREETFSCGGQTNTVRVYRHERTELEFVLVPGGTFLMGSPVDEADRAGDEGPQHRVTVRPFMLCRTEVPQAAWERLMGSNPSHWQGPGLPVEMVDWDQAREWCRKAGLRLPAEGEWEYACRAGTTTPFCHGETIHANQANFDGNGVYGPGVKGEYRGKTTEVGMFAPNAFGLFDMHGNVYEWCQDAYHDGYVGAPGDGGAWSGGSSRRVIRGGCWLLVPRCCRSAFRLWREPVHRDNCMGFRPAGPSF